MSLLFDSTNKICTVAKDIKKVPCGYKVEYRAYCELKNITLRTLYLWKKQKKIQTIKEGNHSYVLINKDEDITMAINSHKKNIKEVEPREKEIINNLVEIQIKIGSLINSLSHRGIEK